MLHKQFISLKNLLTRGLPPLCAGLLAVGFIWGMVGSAQASAAPLSTAPADVLPEPALPQAASGLNKPALLAAGENSLVIELLTPAFQVKETPLPGGSCQALSVPGYASTDQPGWPQLPLSGALVGIPADAEIELRLLAADPVDAPGIYNLCPAARPEIEDDLNGQVSLRGYQLWKDPRAYRQNRFLPEQPAELLSTGFVRSQRVAQVRFQPFQYNPASGRLRYFRRIRVEVRFVNAAPLKPGPAQTLDEGLFENVLRSSLLNYAQARPWRAPSKTAGAATSVQSASYLPPPPPGTSAFKFLVDKDGIYTVTYEALVAAGADFTGISPDSFQLFNQGAEAAIYVSGAADQTFDPGDYLLFYGQAVDTKYTGTNVYFLRMGGGPGKRMSSVNVSPNGAQVPASFRHNQHIEKNTRVYNKYPSGPNQDVFYWDNVTATSGPASKTFTTTLINIAPSAPISATLRGLLKGYYAAPQHHTRIYLNNHLVDDALWSSFADYTFTVDIPQGYLVEGVNTIKVECPFDNSITSDIVLVNYFELDYADQFVAENDYLEFSGDDAGNWEFQVGGFSNPGLELYDITQPGDVARLEGFQVGPANLLVFGATIPTPPRRYLAQAVAQRQAPAQVLPDPYADLHAVSNAADYIIITHPDFITSLLPLADYRAGQGLRVKMVDVFDVYDEFNEGLVHPEAIQAFLAYAYAHWVAPAPMYAVLVGDSSIDLRDYVKLGRKVFIPSYRVPYVDPVGGETVADSRLAMVNGADSLPDIALGRLPVSSVAQADLMVGKILSYESQALQTWSRDILFIADDQDTGGDFDALSDDVADHYLPPIYTADKVYYKINYLTAAEARAAIVNKINTGVLLVNYVGHASYSLWGGERYMDSAQASQLNNASNLTFFMPMTCLEGMYDAGVTTVSEFYLLRDGGGAVGSWSPTGFGFATGHDYLNRGFYQAVFFDNTPQVGLAAMQGYLYLFANSGGTYLELLDTYLLLGDPALRLHIQYPLLIPYYAEGSASGFSLFSGAAGQ